MRKTGSAIDSIFQTKDQDGAPERVLRATFWLPSHTRGKADVIALDAFRAQRERMRK
jgi:hypothetical protein